MNRVIAKPGEEFLTKKELAALLKVGVRTVNSIMARGDIRFSKLSGHLVRFHVEDVQRYLDGLPPRSSGNSQSAIADGQRPSTGGAR